MIAYRARAQHEHAEKVSAWRGRWFAEFERAWAQLERWAALGDPAITRLWVEQGRVSAGEVARHPRRAPSRRGVRLRSDRRPVVAELDLSDWRRP